MRAFRDVARDHYVSAKIKTKEHKLFLSAVHYSIVTNITFINKKFSVLTKLSLKVRFFAKQI